jgi:hypothetical protein
LNYALINPFIINIKKTTRIKLWLVALGNNKMLSSIKEQYPNHNLHAFTEINTRFLYRANNKSFAQWPSQSPPKWLRIFLHSLLSPQFLRRLQKSCFYNFQSVAKSTLPS